MRAINEDDVKRLIRSEKRNWVLTQFHGVTEALNHVEGGLVGIRTVESPMPRWISVEERLPEERLCVSVYIKETDGVYWIETAFRRDGKWRIQGEYVIDRNITHWMHLPKPPKEEK